MKTKPIYILAVLLILFGTACKKNGITDGGLSKEKLNMTTYDFLKSNPHQMFDTTLLIIDKAGMKDLINSSGTFFVPNDYAIANFLNANREMLRKKDEKYNFTIDSLFKYYTPEMLRNGMGEYFFPERIERAALTSEGKSYQSSTTGVAMDVSLEESDQYTVDGLIRTKPKYIYLNKIIAEKDLLDGLIRFDPSEDTELLDIRTRCQTSGIITTTGIIHVLSNNHVWTFKQSLKK